MNLLIKTLKWALLSVIILIAVLYITDTDYLIKAVRTVYFKGYTTASIDDYVYFDNAVVRANTTEEWPLHKDYNKSTATKKLLELHKSQGTVAYLIIKNDSILHESY